MADLFALDSLAAILQDNLDTATITELRTGATNLIANYLGATSLTTGTATESFPARGHTAILLRHLPVTAVSAVTVDGVSQVAADWVVDEAGVLTRADGWSWSGLVSVTYDYGYATPPPGVREVALDVARRAYVNPELIRSETIGSVSVAVGGSSGGSDVFQLTPDNMRVLDRYRA